MLRKYFAETFALNVSDKLNNHNVKYFYELFYDSIHWSRDKVVSFQIEKVKELIRIFL